MTPPHDGQSERESKWACAHPTEVEPRLYTLMTPTGRFIPGRTFSLREAEEFCEAQGWNMSIAFNARL